MGLEKITIAPSAYEKYVAKNIDAHLVSEKESERPEINIEDFLSLISQGAIKVGHIHEFLEKSELHMYSTPFDSRNPELEERIQKLKAEQANKEYKSMVKGLFSQQQGKVSLSEDVKSVTSQVTAVINFVLSVGGSFIFAFKAVEYALPEQNIPAQVMMGIVTSTVVALADLYFLARTI